MNREPPDYLTLGHVTVDVTADGSRKVGGTAFYSALQAARLGLRARILTQGVPRELEALLEPHRSELELEIVPAEHTTTLATTGSGARREQRVLAWAGRLPEELTLDCAILHLAPVARELPGAWRSTGSFVGLTPQGLLREWGEDGVISLRAPAGPPHEATHGAPAVETVREHSGGYGALVLSAAERASCPELVDRARRGGAIVAVTDGAAPSRVLLPDAEELELAVPPVREIADDLGAGDVCAAAFFVALARGDSPRAAMALGNAAAAVRMHSHGPAGVGDRGAIEARRAAGGSATPPLSGPEGLVDQP